MSTGTLKILATFKIVSICLPVAASETCSHICITEWKNLTFFVYALCNDKLKVTVSVLCNCKISNRTCVRIKNSWEIFRQIMYFRFRQRMDRDLRNWKNFLRMFCGKDRFILNVWFRMIRQEVLPGSENMDRWCRKNFWQKEFLWRLMCRWRFTVRSEKRRKKRANPYGKVLFPLYKVT